MVVFVALDNISKTSFILNTEFQKLCYFKYGNRGGLPFVLFEKITTREAKAFAPAPKFATS